MGAIRIVLVYDKENRCIHKFKGKQ